MANFFVSDWHFGDQRVKDILKRPFETPQAMAEHIVSEHNKVVGPTDTVYVLGDVFSKDTAFDAQLIERLNGHLILLMGNHDVHGLHNYQSVFDQVVPEGQGIELQVDGLPCFLVHYPTLSRPDRFNLVGHIHGAWRVAKNALNVGVDAHFFRPLSEQDVRFYFEAICKHYDQDAWISDLPAMRTHQDRGRPGSYFPNTDDQGRDTTSR